MPKLETRIPAWQIVVVLVFPILYAINARLPWSEGLWVDHDKSYFVPFWISVIALHSVAAILVVHFLRRSEVTASQIGFHLDSRRAVTTLLWLGALGLAAVAIRQIVPYENVDDLGLQIGWPTSQPERLFWILVCLFAGVCEELIFRGFAIPALESRGFKVWHAVLISTVSFSVIHGAADLTVTGISFVAGLLFAALYVWRRNLALVMVVHALSDLSFILTT